MSADQSAARARNAETNAKTYWRRYFEERAAGQTKAHERVGYALAATARTMHRVVGEVVGQVSGLDILDVGCGDGQVTGHLAVANRVTGVDFSLSMLRHARRCGLNPVGADITALPFVATSFDLVLCVEAMTCLPEPLKVVEGLVRMLRPGGRLIITGLNRASILRQVASRICGAVGIKQPRLVDSSRCAAMLRDHGLAVEPVLWVSYFIGKTGRRSGGSGIVLQPLIATNFLIEARKTL